MRDLRCVLFVLALLGLGQLLTWSCPLVSPTADAPVAHTACCDRCPAEPAPPAPEPQHPGCACCAPLVAADVVSLPALPQLLVTTLDWSPQRFRALPTRASHPSPVRAPPDQLRHWRVVRLQV